MARFRQLIPEAGAIGVWLKDPAYAATLGPVDLGLFRLGGDLGTGSASHLWAPERHVAGLQQAVS